MNAPENITVDFCIRGGFDFTDLHSIVDDTRRRINTERPLITAAKITPVVFRELAARVTLVLDRAHAPVTLAYMLAKLRRVFPRVEFGTTPEKAVSINSSRGADKVVQSILNRPTQALARTRR